MSTLNRRPTRPRQPSPPAITQPRPVVVPERAVSKPARGGEIGDGLRDAFTVIAAYIPFSLALGAALASSGVNPFTAWASSALIFAGAVQLVSVQLLADGAGITVTVLTGLAMNSRHLLYGASLSPHTRTWSRKTRGLAAYFLADPVYALAIARFESRDDAPRARLRYYLAMALTCWVGWMVLTATGGLVAGALPTALPLDLAAPLTFLLLLIPTLKDHPSYIAASVAGAAAVAAAELPLGLGLLVAAALGIAAGAATERIRRA